MILLYIWKYWGKALPRTDGVPAHAFVYHCLDVVVVADAWIAASTHLRRRFALFLPWVRFFIALHDFGKVFIRFQAKSRAAIDLLRNYEDVSAQTLNREATQKYRHGPAGFAWLGRELGAVSGTEEDGDSDAQWDRWSSWMGAVAGHHGAICVAQDLPLFRHTHPDRAARAEWLQLAAQTFLAPAGLSLRDDPPPLSDELRAFIAGFCAICDWLGSNEAFPYCIEPTEDLHAYLASRREIAEAVLRNSGVIRPSLREGGILTALAAGQVPHQIQRYIDSLSIAPGLTLIEAPTGSGKTEAAIGLAARLLAADLADSVIFALPTQATSNAMLPRLKEIAPRLFPGSDVNLILAHGRAAFNADAIHLRKTVQLAEEATVHQAEWLSQSRKRVFLGQIGVCTIDQVLLSVLPVRHHFVRSFSLGRSVLIVDEVHAYDAYMYGLLRRVLEQQREAGGSAILLSATLPWHQRQQLIRAWRPNAIISLDNDYPLLTQVADDGINVVAPAQEDRPPSRIVRIDTRHLPDVLPDEKLIQELLDAAARGARVAVIVNLVADAQKLARQLRAISAHPVDLFHSRFRFRDRMQRESEVLNRYGKGAPRLGGRILVATQVVEQSLDLDFDWMVTQLCPADLLFQRFGRLHRHVDDARPDGFVTPCCTVLLRVDGEDYGSHGKVYGDQRALWRTERRLLELTGAAGSIEFPAAYRDWVESVYRDEDGDEPGWVRTARDHFWISQDAALKQALRISGDRVELLNDDDAIIVALTRDGERSLSILPLLDGCASETLLDGRPLSSFDQFELRENVMLNTVNAPASWQSALPQAQEDGTVRLPMHTAGAHEWEWQQERGTVRYSVDYGMERSQP